MKNMFQLVCHENGRIFLIFDNQYDAADYAEAHDLFTHFRTVCYGGRDNALTLRFLEA